MKKPVEASVEKKMKPVDIDCLRRNSSREHTER